MRRQLLLAMIAVTATMCASDDAVSDTPRSRSVSGAAGAVQLELRQARAAEAGKVLVIAREPESGLTIWAPVDDVEPGAVERFFTLETSPGSAILAAGQDRLVRITGGGLDLIVQESRQRYPSLAAAATAIDPAAKIPPAVRFIVVRLYPHIDHAYFSRRDLAHSFGPRLTGLRPSDGQWLLTLTGDNGRVATVTLDSDYHVIDVQKDR